MHGHQSLYPSGLYLCCGQIFKTHSCWIATVRPHFITKILSIPSHSVNPAGADFPWLAFSVPRGPVLLRPQCDWSVVREAEISNGKYKARDCWEAFLSSFEDPGQCGRSARSRHKPQPLQTLVCCERISLRPLIFLPCLCVRPIWILKNKGLSDHHREIWLIPWQAQWDLSLWVAKQDTLNGLPYLNYDMVSCGGRGRSALVWPVIIRVSKTRDFWGKAVSWICLWESDFLSSLGMCRDRDVCGQKMSPRCPTPL